MEIRLSRAEYDLINKIRSRDTSVRIEELGVPKSTAMALIELLRSKGLVEIKEIVQESYALTERGRRYLEKGFPEEILSKISRNRKIYLSEASESPPFKKEPKLLEAAIGELRKKGVIEFGKDEKGFFIFFKSPPEVPERELLKRLQAGEKLSKKDISLLAKRGLIKREVKKTLLIRPLPVKAELVVEVAKLNRRLLESGEWRNVRLKRYDVSASPPEVFAGKPHPYALLLDEVRDILIGMGFREVKSPIVEAEFWNFDVLFQAQDHPAREVHDSYMIAWPNRPADLEQYKDLIEKVRSAHENGFTTGSSGWGYSWSFDIARRLILRSQMTAASARSLAEGLEIPSKIFAIDKVFRPENLDRTHAAEFYQCEGVVLAEDLNVRHLMGFLKEFVLQLGFKEVRFKPAYFPFTEPSVEAYVKHEDLGWLEIAGSGLFRPEMMVPLGYDFPRVQALAWGIGIGRLAMLRLGLDDIRDLHSQDLDYLRKHPLIF